MHPLFAYIDPGTGAIIVQALIAGAVAIPLFFRAQIAKGISAIRRVGRRGEHEPARDH